MGKIAISKLRRDGGTQFRVNKHEDVIEEYAAAIRRGERLPPVVAFYDGTDHWLADGFHTTDAHELTGAKEIEADIRAGTLRDAVLYAATEANRAHGIRFTNEEKRSRVLALLKDEEWSRWSNVVIADRCGVDDKTVAKYRAEICPQPRNSEVRTGKDGKERRLPAKPPAQDKPKAPPVRVVKDRAAADEYYAAEAAMAGDESQEAPEDESEPVRQVETGYQPLFGGGAGEVLAGKPAPEPWDTQAESRRVNAMLDEEIESWPRELRATVLAGLFTEAVRRARA